MNTEHIRALIEGVASAHRSVCAAAYGYRHGTRDWDAVAEAIRREGDAVGALASAMPEERVEPDPDEAREAARNVHWDAI